jgi:hypothetical protein
MKVRNPLAGSALKIAIIFRFMGARVVIARYAKLKSSSNKSLFEQYRSVLGGRAEAYWRCSSGC